MVGGEKLASEDFLETLILLQRCRISIGARVYGDYANDNFPSEGGDLRN